MWTKKTANKFESKVNYLLTKARVNFDDLKLCLKQQPKLLDKFLLFSSCKNSSDGFLHYIKAGINCSICPVCSKRFLHKSTGITGVSYCCRLCQTTPKGKAYVLKCRESTCLVSHGVKNPGQSEKVKVQMRKTCRKKLGVDYSFQSDKVKNKIKNTIFDRYKVTNISQSKDHQNKKEITCLKNYGVRHPLQSSKLRFKASLNSGRLWQVKTPRKKYYVEGYERFIVNTLENKFDIVLSQFDKDFEPIILDNILYSPDFYIPKTNLYIEIKSTYTLYVLNSEFKLNKIKAEKSVEQGCNLRWSVVFNSGKIQHYILLPKYWFRMSKHTLIEYIEQKKKHACFVHKRTTFEKLKIENVKDKRGAKSNS